MRCCAARAIQREASPAVGRAKKLSTHRSRTSVENDKSRAREGDRVTPLRLPDPPLADERVLLRPWQVADLAVIELASRDPAITVGVSGLVWRHLRGSLGYWVTGAQRRGGLASAAVGLLVPWTFGALGLVRVEAVVDVDNQASQRVLERNGFRPEGVLRSYYEMHGAWRDMVMFARLADSPPRRRAGDRGVQAGDLAGHWDADQHVAGLADQPVQAGALAADHHADGLVGQV